MSREEIIDHLSNAMNGLAMGWQMANVKDDAKREELQAPINSATRSVLALLAHFEPTIY